MTAQMPEVLIIDGERTSMAFCPPLPKKHPRIVTRDADDSAETSIPIFRSTACWRGYRGTWEIKNGQFYLVGLEGHYRLRGSEPLPATWFSGVLRVPRGGLLQYVHMGFGSVYEEELHIKIEKGGVTKTRVVDNRGKQHDRWKLSRRNLPGRENRFPGDDET